MSFKLMNSKGLSTPVDDVTRIFSYKELHNLAWYCEGKCHKVHTTNPT